MKSSIKDSLKHRLTVLANLHRFAETDAGTTLQEKQVDYIVSTLRTLSKNYHTMTHTELIALCARLECSLGILDTLREAEAQSERTADQLEQAIVDTDT
jgi:hypothetical protein